MTNQPTCQSFLTQLDVGGQFNFNAVNSEAELPFLFSWSNVEENLEFQVTPCIGWIEKELTPNRAGPSCPALSH